MGQCGTLTFQKKWGPLGAPNNFFMIMILKPEQNAIIWSIKHFSSTAHFKVVASKHAKLFHYAPPPPKRQKQIERKHQKQKQSYKNKSKAQEIRETAKPQK